MIDNFNRFEDLIALLLKKVNSGLNKSKRISLRKFILKLFLRRLLVAIIIATDKFLVLCLKGFQNANIDRILAKEHEIAFGNFLKDSRVTEYTPKGTVVRKATSLEVF